MEQLNGKTQPLDLSFQNKTKKGEATAGKTQLCLRLLLTAQLPEVLGGLDGSALWLCSEKGDPPVRRLAQLAKFSSAAAAASPSSHAAPSTDNVFVEKGLATPADLMEALDRMEPLMMTAKATMTTATGAGGVGVGVGNGARRRRRIRLVVIDSIAALFRDASTAAAAPTGAADGGAGRCSGVGGDGGSQRSLYAARAAALFAVASRLKRLADDHSLAVVVVNQVTDVISDGAEEDAGGVRALPPPPHPSSSAALASSSFSSSSSSSRAPTHTAGLRLVSSGREVAPALGLAWASCVGIRLFLSRLAPVGSSSFGGGGGGGNGDGGENLFPPGARAAATRRLQVVFAPHLPAPSSCLATVDARGLVGVGGEGGVDGKRQRSPAAAAAAAAPQQQPVVCSGVFA